jgi:hypothetical protein
MTISIFGIGLKNISLPRDPDHKDGKGRIDLPPINRSRCCIILWAEIDKGRQEMKKKEFKPEQIITMLREAEVVLAQGSTAVEVVRKPGITEQTSYR